MKMNNESGRSMVEMLGVLAIIGVLSVGGIAGYTMAMNKYKANEIMSAASQCMVLIRSGNNGDGYTSDTSCSDLGVTHANLSTGKVASGTTTITLTGLTATDGVCKALRGISGNVASACASISFS